MKLFCSTLLLIAGLLTNAQFTNIIEESNVNHHHQTDVFIGGGAAFFDYNNDGWLDLYVTGGFDHDRLFQNDSKGSFIDVSKGSLIERYTRSGYSFGVTYGDINNDGCQDLFIYTYDKGSRNKLLLNNCDGRFVEITIPAKLMESSSSSGAAFIDYNNDGFLDLYVINYIDEFFFVKDEEGNIVDLEGTCLPNFFYRNKQDLSFEEISRIQNLDDAGCGLSVVTSDYDQDGDFDLYVANDHGETVLPNTLFKSSNNNLSKASENGMELAFYSMGIGTGDYDMDGDIDYYVTSIGNNALLKNQEGQFVRVEEDLGVENGVYSNGNYTTGWGANFFDYDNDRDLDLFISNGFIDGGFLDVFTTKSDTNKFFVNDGGNFTDFSNAYDLNIDYINRGSITGDIDNDGDLDLYVVTIGDGSQKSMLYRNDFDFNNNYLKLKLEGTVSNRNAFGSTVYLHSNGDILVRELSSGGSHASQSSPYLHFGLGIDVDIDSLQVVWPNGMKKTFYNVPTNEFLYVMEGEESYKILGCMNPDSENYNANATENFGCVYQPVFGCTVKSSLNYKPEANVIDNSCSDFPDLPLAFNKETDLNLFPQPAIDYVRINGLDISQHWIVNIYSLNGTLVSTSFLKPYQEHILSVIDYLDKMYIVQFSNEANLYTSKLLLR